MPSNWGKRHGLPGFDKLRTGLDYQTVYTMLMTSTRHKARRRGSVLGFWHELKLQFYEQAVDCGYLDEEEGHE